jgi:hypothetical protein
MHCERRTMTNPCYDEIRAASGLSDLSDEEAQSFADSIKATRSTSAV